VPHAGSYFPNDVGRFLLFGGRLDLVGPAEQTLVVIEDDHHIADLVAMYLRRDGFRVLQAADGESGLDLVGREHPDLLIVDIGLPGALDGLDVCRALRSRSERTAARAPDVPILVLSARDDEVDRVLGLELGADDYVTKPFSPRELVARVHAILRRATVTGPALPPVTTFGPIEVDTGRREARLDGEVVPLATREFDLLAYLADNRGLALSRRQLLNGVWGDGWFGDERTVDVHVRQLRKKLGEGLPLATVWGVGYRLG
jgi:DNA-binding response OmpR family regulator